MRDFRCVGCGQTIRMRAFLRIRWRRHECFGCGKHIEPVAVGVESPGCKTFMRRWVPYQGQVVLYRAQMAGHLIVYSRDLGFHRTPLQAIRGSLYVVDLPGFFDELERVNAMVRHASSEVSFWERAMARAYPNSYSRGIGFDVQSALFTGELFVTQERGHA